MSANPVTTFLTSQLTHAKWGETIHFYDVIFPLFLFISGISIVFSLDKAMASGGRREIILRVLRRSLLLFALGVFVTGGLSRPWPEIALSGILQRIAACYLFGATLYCFLPGTRRLLAASAGLLLGYWAMMAFIPVPDLRLNPEPVRKVAAQIGSNAPSDIATAVPGRVTGSFEQGRNLANWLDFRFLPGRKTGTFYATEGLLSTLPAIAITLFGAIAGRLLKNKNVEPRKKVAWLLGAGVAAVAQGLLWGLAFPIIKQIWTSSFCLFVSGLSTILLAVFYYIVDVKRWRWWCAPFVWIGANALVAYIISNTIDLRETVAVRLAGGSVRDFLDLHVAEGAGPLGVSITALLVTVLLMRFLYNRGIFLRV
jgi:predicted acyltransferase